MKKKIILLCCVLLSVNILNAFSQIVTEDVHFDNYLSSSNNDFVNRFTGGLGLSQITTNGITGGCLVTPNTVNWGNDNAIYCSKYIAAVATYTITSIVFKYDTSQINSVNFDRAVSIFLRPSADYNHYLIASVNYNKRLQIVTYSWANSPPLMNLLHNHWYSFMLNTNFVTGSPLYQINVTSQVNDLGLTGLTPPIPVSSSSGTFYDSLLFGDTAVQVSITGALWGGARYLEDFHFEGIKSADSCISIPTLIGDVDAEEVKATISDNRIVVFNHSLLGEVMLEVYSVSGQKIIECLCHLGHSSFDVSGLAEGVYLMRLTNEKRSRAKRFAVVK